MLSRSRKCREVSDRNLLRDAVTPICPRLVSVSRPSAGWRTFRGLDRPSRVDRGWPDRDKLRRRHAAERAVVLIRIDAFALRASYLHIVRLSSRNEELVYSYSERQLHTDDLLSSIGGNVHAQWLCLFPPLPLRSKVESLEFTWHWLQADDPTIPLFPGELGS